MSQPQFRELGMLSVQNTPSLSSSAIASRLWPGSAVARPLTADQLARLSTAPPSVSRSSRTRPRLEDLALLACPTDVAAHGPLTPVSMVSSSSATSHSSHGWAGVTSAKTTAGRDSPTKPMREAGTPARKSGDNPLPEYGEEMFSVRRKAVPAVFQ